MPQRREIVTPFAGHLENTLLAVGEARRYHAWLAGRVASCLLAPVLEIGAGLGTFARALTDFVQPVHVSEYDANLRKHLANRKAEGIVLGPSISLPLPPARLAAIGAIGPRTVIMSNVLEHVDAEVDALKSLLDIETVDRLILVVPAHEWAFGPLDVQLGHFRRYTVSSLSDVVARSGWRTTNARYFNPLGALAWAFSGRFMGRTQVSSWQTQIVEFAIPLLRVCDSVMRGRAFGQSVIVIADRQT